MIDYIRKKFIENPEKIVEFLTNYDYHHFSIKSTYITFGRSEDSSPKSIVIRLKDNERCIVHDYARNLTYDIINFVIKCRNVEFKEVINYAKYILEINDFSFVTDKKRSAFGGFYENIQVKHNFINKTYSEDILKEYESIGNTKFLRDNISLKTQHEFKIGYCLDENVITIPIWNEIGELIGVKARRNAHCADGEQKYFYLVPCSMSNTLYGYWQNYSNLQDSTVFIFESEKSVMQCNTFGFHNAVSMGSSSLSKKQVQLIIGCNPKNIVLAHDKSLPFETVKRNAEMLFGCGKMKDFKIYYLDMENDVDVPCKASPSDLGKDMFKRIFKNDLKKIEREERK